MREFARNDRISVYAIAGTHVVLLGLNASEEARHGLLGWRIDKRSDARDWRPLRGGSRRFENLDAGESDDSGVMPIQSMLWSDYTVEPGQAYAYRVTPVYGAPGALEPGEPVELQISSEDNDDGKHGVFFNRGVAGSQAYSRLFKDHMKFYAAEEGFGDRARVVGKPYIKPGDVPDGAAFKWLSRGLVEGMTDFIAQAKDESYAIRAAVYEFTWMPVLEKFAAAIDRGADVKVVHHCKHKGEYILKYDRNTSSTSTWKDGSQDDQTFNNRYGLRVSEPDAQAKAAMKSVEKLGVVNGDRFDALKNMLIHRTNTQISHNKFMVLLKDGKPVQVWTGSTNYTGGGIFGQSNVGHVVRDEAVAQRYFDYWTMLSEDPKSGPSKDFVGEQQPDLTGEPPEGITCIFSPRREIDMLEWYAERMAQAKGSVFFTTAFTVASQILEVVKDDSSVADGPFRRYVLAEGNGGLLRDKIPVIQACDQNAVAWGDVLRKRKGDELDEMDLQLETLTGLNDHVNFLHTKYMLIDPLGDDPLVVSGSANFSENSTTKNDENMLVIRGNTRVADMFLVEFMRLFNHFHSRNTRNAMSDEAFEETGFLASDDSWCASYYDEGSADWNERMLFAGPGKEL